MTTATKQSTSRSTARKRRGSTAEPDSQAPRTGAKRTVMHTVKQIPAYLRLLTGLLTDGRVSVVDKLLVAGAIVYIISPLDLIPDFIPFLGEVDDMYLLMLALQRLVTNAGMTVVVAHWTGDPDELSRLNVHRAFSAAAFFLPRRIRNALGRMVVRRKASA
ncbi:MAG: YkvA family protein [Gemmatimonadaceae bacterium]